MGMNCLFQLERAANASKVLVSAQRRFLGAEEGALEGENLLPQARIDSYMFPGCLRKDTVNS